MRRLRRQFKSMKSTFIQHDVKESFLEALQQGRPCPEVMHLAAGGFIGCANSQAAVPVYAIRILPGGPAGGAVSRPVPGRGGPVREAPQSAESHERHPARGGAGVDKPRVRRSRGEWKVAGPGQSALCILLASSSESCPLPLQSLAAKLHQVRGEVQAVRREAEAHEQRRQSAAPSLADPSVDEEECRMLIARRVDEARGTEEAIADTGARARELEAAIARAEDEAAGLEMELQRARAAGTRRRAEEGRAAQVTAGRETACQRRARAQRCGPCFALFGCRTTTRRQCCRPCAPCSATWGVCAW